MYTLTLLSIVFLPCLSPCPVSIFYVFLVQFSSCLSLSPLFVPCPFSLSLFSLNRRGALCASLSLWACFFLESASCTFLLLSTTFQSFFSLMCPCAYLRVQCSFRVHCLMFLAISILMSFDFISNCCLSDSSILCMFFLICNS